VDVSLCLECFCEWVSVWRRRWWREGGREGVFFPLEERMGDASFLVLAFRRRKKGDRRKEERKKTTNNNRRDTHTHVY